MQERHEKAHGSSDDRARDYVGGEVVAAENAKDCGKGSERETSCDDGDFHGAVGEKRAESVAQERRGRKRHRRVP